MLAALDVVTRDDAQPTSSAVHLKGHTSLTYGELAEPVGEFERALRHGGKPLASWDAVRDWRPSAYTGPIDTFGLPPVTALPTTVAQLTHECGTDGRLAGAFRELIG
jgi:hypothetical protein